MKKKLTLIFLLFISIKCLACQCGSTDLIYVYSISDFVATAKILDITKENDESKYLKVKIEITNLYKGDQTSTITTFIGTMCRLFFNKNEEWLILGTKDENGNLSTGYCSLSMPLYKDFNYKEYPNAEENYKRMMDRKLEVLQFLKNENIISSNEYHLNAHFSSELSKKFKGIEIKGDMFSLFELTVNENLRIENVISLKEFDDKKLSKKLEEFIKQDATIHQINHSNKATKTKIIIALYYHPLINKEMSYIGER